jgi:hypothetical protein
VVYSKDVASGYLSVLWIRFVNYTKNNVLVTQIQNCRLNNFLREKLYPDAKQIWLIQLFLRLKDPSLYCLSFYCPDRPLHSIDSGGASTVITVHAGTCTQNI